MHCWFTNFPSCLARLLEEGRSLAYNDLVNLVLFPLASNGEVRVSRILKEARNTSCLFSLGVFFTF
jgi:hypothetical protein